MADWEEVSSEFPKWCQRIGGKLSKFRENELSCTMESKYGGARQITSIIMSKTPSGEVKLTAFLRVDANIFMGNETIIRSRNVLDIDVDEDTLTLELPQGFIMEVQPTPRKAGVQVIGEKPKAIKVFLKSHNYSIISEHFAK
ncbi:MAG: hypothetical protein DRN14_04105 [Thermoplasmata archaeon]|nr:MAG: hypothetical protein DRN14_04105 [Thermoplasmata archaeon]